MAKVKTAVFVPSYCLALNKKRLTFMSYGSVVLAADAASNESARVILSTAYITWKTELTLKQKVLKEHGVSKDNIMHVQDVTDSFDEMGKVRDIVSKYEITRLILVAEFWHALRAWLICMYMMPNVKLRVVMFTTSGYERTHEPHPIRLLGYIKSVRASNVILWIAWNMVMTALTPFVIIWRSFRS